MRVSKEDRATVFAKYGGRCAYCGCDLPERWHVDHVEPLWRTTYWKPGGKPQNPENHALENFNPSCPPCNIDKGASNLEWWRKALKVKLEHARKQPNVRMLEKHGLLTTHDVEVRFYFERLTA